ncbi:dynamin family protein [Anopheles sinensis]|uniref:Dynamin family protein n=1 Tax=Anopheles sinensis TaxID=74873 RepID=A0A084VYW9_ANOSI|nr:dynamin family protein [Anopheles sinensis]
MEIYGVRPLQIHGIRLVDTPGAGYDGALGRPGNGKCPHRSGIMLPKAVQPSAVQDTSVVCGPTVALLFGSPYDHFEVSPSERQVPGNGRLLPCI